MLQVLPSLREILTVFMLLTVVGFTGYAQGSLLNQNQRHAFEIPAGSLASALNNYALHANIVMVFDPALAEGRSTKGLAGTFTVQEGFAVLLKGTGLVATRDSLGHYTISSIVGQGEKDSIVQLDLLKVHVSDAASQAIYESPSSDGLVQREQIERVPPRNTSDVLASVTGLHTSQSRQDPGVSINIRGLQDFGRVNMMIDGTRQNFQRSGHGSNGSLYMDPQLLSGVDVSKGPSSTSGGAAVIGGVVNFRTLDFDDLVDEGNEAGGRVSVSTGTNAYHFSGNIAAATKLSDDVRLVAAMGSKRVGEFNKGSQGGNADQDGYHTGGSQFTDQSQQSALLKTQWDISSAQAIKLSYIGFKADFDEGGDTNDQAAESVNSLSVDTLLANYIWQPSDDVINLAASLYYTQTRNDQFRRETQELQNAYGEFDVYYETNTLGSTLTNESLIDFSEIDSLISLNYGAEFYYDWTRPQANQQTEGEGRESWFTGPTPKGDRYVASLFAQSEFSHAIGFDAVLGLRYDHYSLQGDGKIHVGEIDNPSGVRPSTTDLYTNFDVARNQGYWSPSLTLSHQVSDVFQVFTNYSYGIRPPSITESLMWGMHVGNTFPFFPNPSLVAERAKSFELGANIGLSELLNERDKLNIKTVLFDNRIDNYMTAAPIMGPASTSENALSLAYVNLDNQVRFFGYEILAEYESEYFFSEFNFTRTITDLGRGGYDPYPLGSIVGYPPTSHGYENGGTTFYLSSPEIKAAWSNGMRLIDRRLVLGLRIRKESNGKAGGNDSESYKNWQVYDLWAKYNAHSHMTFNLSIDNATDQNYGELNGMSYWVAPGTTVIASMTLNF